MFPNLKFFKFNKFIAPICILLVTGCANINTIDRETGISTKDGEGKAIHLDVQQRVVMVNSALKYCAEPSPDALATYASSLGLSISDPTGNATSLSQGGHSNAANIGLRTQSITLMRDALYRMCEAFANKAVNKSDVAIFLSKSQDLTAVLLAVEQLTGAMKANTVTLTGTSNTSAMATLLSNQKVLEQAREYEAKKKTELDNESSELDSLKQTLTLKITEETNAESKLKELQKPREPKPSDSQIEQAEKALALAKNATENAQIKVNKQDAVVKLSEKHYNEAKENRTLIEQNKDSAIAQTTSSTSGNANISPVNSQKMSDAQAQFVASAVQNMVTSVVNKPYIYEMCSTAINGTNQDLKNTCIEIIKQKLNIELEKIKVDSTFSHSETTTLLKDAIKTDVSLRAKIENWLKTNNHKFSPTSFIYGEQYESLRVKFLKEQITK